MHKVLLVVASSLLLLGVIVWSVLFDNASVFSIPEIAVLWAESHNDAEQADRARFERVGQHLKAHELVSKYTIDRAAARTFEVILAEKWSQWDFAAKKFASVLCDANNPDFLFKGQHLHDTWKVKVLLSGYQPGADCVIKSN